METSKIPELTEAQQAEVDQRMEPVLQSVVTLKVRDEIKDRMIATARQKAIEHVLCAASEAGTVTEFPMVQI